MATEGLDSGSVLAEVEGISALPGGALDLAVEDGRTIRPIGEFANGGIRVGPRLVPEQSPLAVSGTANVVRTDTRHAGRLHVSGRGSDSTDTAVAALMDVTRLA